MATAPTVRLPPTPAFGLPSTPSAGRRRARRPLFVAQTDLTAIDAPAAWLLSTGDPSVVVAVLDTGIDAAHPEFAGRLVPGFDALTGLADSPGDFSPTNDDEGHGTHVSGTVAAAANNGLGIAGIAPNTSIMPVKILDSTGEGDFGDMVVGMNWAISHGARIITMSLGGTLDAAGVANVAADVRCRVHRRRRGRRGLRQRWRQRSTSTPATSSTSSASARPAAMAPP